MCLTGCDSPPDDRVTVKASDTQLFSSQPDSVRLAQIAIRAMPRTDSLSLRVRKVEKDVNGYLFTLAPQAVVVGGGGIVRVSFIGTAAIVTRFQ
jgi:hypothetical protein